MDYRWVRKAVARGETVNAEILSLDGVIYLALINVDIVSDMQGHLWLALFVLGSGVIISGLSTFFATRRFLNLRSDELYY